MTTSGSYLVSTTETADVLLPKVSALEGYLSEGDAIRVGSLVLSAEQATSPDSLSDDQLLELVNHRKKRLLDDYLTTADRAAAYIGISIRDRPEALEAPERTESSPEINPYKDIQGFQDFRRTIRGKLLLWGIHEPIIGEDDIQHEYGRLVAFTGNRLYEKLDTLELLLYSLGTEPDILRAELRTRQAEQLQEGLFDKVSALGERALKPKKERKARKEGHITISEHDRSVNHYLNKRYETDATAILDDYLQNALMHYCRELFGSTELVLNMGKTDDVRHYDSFQGRYDLQITQPLPPLNLVTTAIKSRQDFLLFDDNSEWAKKIRDKANSLYDKDFIRYVKQAGFDDAALDDAKLHPRTRKRIMTAEELEQIVKLENMNLFGRMVMDKYAAALGGIRQDTANGSTIQELTKIVVDQVSKLSDDSEFRPGQEYELLNSVLAKLASDLHPDNLKNEYPKHQALHVLDTAVWQNLKKEMRRRANERVKNRA